MALNYMVCEKVKVRYSYSFMAPWVIGDLGKRSGPYLRSISTASHTAEDSVFQIKTIKNRLTTPQ
jgi:hypothetical protein